MAWNPEPEVAAARDFVNNFDADRVVIIWTSEAGQCRMASYGRTKSLCDQTKLIGVMLHCDAMTYFDNQRVGVLDRET